MNNKQYQQRKSELVSLSYSHFFSYLGLIKGISKGMLKASALLVKASILRVFGIASDKERQEAVTLLGKAHDDLQAHNKETERILRKWQMLRESEEK